MNPSDTLSASYIILKDYVMYEAPYSLEEEFSPLLLSRTVGRGNFPEKGRTV
jgi:hypothetical protein